MPSVRELSPDDATALAALYADYEWWEDRTPDEVCRALDETEVAMGVEEDSGDDGRALVAAARVLTDYTYYATVFDVARNRRFLAGQPERKAFW